MSENEEVIYSLYVHTFPNGKVYVGITSRDPEERWEYGCGYLKVRKDGRPIQPKIYYAIKKYGWYNVKSTVLLQSKFKDEIEKQERYFITEVYHSDQTKFGYNVDRGGSFCGRVSESTRKLQSKIFSGKNNPQYGKHYWNNGKIQIVAKECPGPDFVRGGLPRSEEFCQRMKDLAANPEIKKKKHESLCRLNMHERRWWNNGKEQRFAKECPGSDFVLGQLPMPENDKRHDNNKKGYLMWNNGIEQTMSPVCPGEGWIRGCLPLSEEKNRIKQEKRKQTCLNKYGVDNVNCLPQLIEAHKQNCGKNSPNFGKKWWNNGYKNILSEECPGLDFKPGMLILSKKSNNYEEHLDEEIYSDTKKLKFKEIDDVNKEYE